MWKLNKNQLKEIKRIAEGSGLQLNDIGTRFMPGQEALLLKYLKGIERTTLVVRLEEEIFKMMDAGSVPHTPSWLVSRARQAPEMRYVRITVGERAIFLSFGQNTVHFPFNNKTNYPETLAAMIAAAGKYKGIRKTATVPVSRGDFRGNGSLIVVISRDGRAHVDPRAIAAAIDAAFRRPA